MFYLQNPYSLKLPLSWRAVRNFIKSPAGDINYRVNMSAFPEDFGEISFEVATDNSTDPVTVEATVVQFINQEVM